MACKYKYNNKWYSEERVKKLIESNITTDDIALELLKNNSFAVEVNTAKDETVLADMRYEGSLPNTKHYANLTVPGGTNYTENEIKTPAIIPNIKGHAQFSTDNGIGWFRSDEQEVKPNNLTETQLNNIPDEYKEEAGFKGSKTRRILEVQSDLFQKGRDKKDLVRNKSLRDGFKYKGDIYNVIHEDEYEQLLIVGKNGKEIPWNEYVDAYQAKERNIKNSENNFLQLLNKKSAWINFFIQSIIQDSVKKGYEKVLFPKGETAAKVEGHNVIAEQIRDIDKRIYNIKYISAEPGIPIEAVGTLSRLTDNDKKELEKLEQEKQNLKTQGLEKLAPIEHFYGNVVSKKLKSLYGNNVKEITDEYGNKWVEITLEDNKKAEEPFDLELPEENLTEVQKQKINNIEVNLNKEGITLEDIDELERC